MSVFFFFFFLDGQNSAQRSAPSSAITSGKPLRSRTESDHSSVIAQRLFTALPWSCCLLSHHNIFVHMFVSFKPWISQGRAYVVFIFISHCLAHGLWRGGTNANLAKRLLSFWLDSFPCPLSKLHCRLLGLYAVAAEWPGGCNTEMDNSYFFR